MCPGLFHCTGSLRGFILRSRYFKNMIMPLSFPLEKKVVLFLSFHVTCANMDFASWVWGCSPCKTPKSVWILPFCASVCVRCLLGMFLFQGSWIIKLLFLQPHRNLQSQ